MKKAYLFELAGAYGGQFYCLAEADNIEEARNKARIKYPSNDYRDYDVNATSINGDAEISFDEDGISEVFQYSW